MESKEKTDNELIVDFMGGYHKGLLRGVDWDVAMYDKSWDWLMPVVEKVESIWDDYHGYFGVHINSNSCTIQGTKLRTNPENYHPAYFADYTLGSKIESTYAAIVVFIIWYNENIKS